MRGRWTWARRWRPCAPLDAVSAPCAGGLDAAGRGHELGTQAAWGLAIASLVVALGPIAIAMTVPGLGPIGYISIATLPFGLIGVVLIPILLVLALADRLRGRR